jgi:hypothetical protein
MSENPERAFRVLARAVHERYLIAVAASLTFQAPSGATPLTVAVEQEREEENDT